MNWSPEPDALGPPRVTTCTSTVPTPGGEVAVIWVSEATEKVAGTRPKVTSVAPVKPEPSIVTAVPPVTGPLAGETPVTLGAVRERAASVTTVWPGDREKVADRPSVRPRPEASLARDPVPPAHAGTRLAGTLAVPGAVVV